MATNFVQDGDVIPFTAGSALSSGDAVVIGGLLGVVISDVASGATGQASISGVFNVPKVDGAVITEGMPLVYDVSAGALDDSAATPASGDLVNCGIAVESKGTTTGESIAILLNVPGATITA